MGCAVSLILLLLLFVMTIVMWQKWSFKQNLLVLLRSLAEVRVDRSRLRHHPSSSEWSSGLMMMVYNLC